MSFSTTDGKSQVPKIDAREASLKVLVELEKKDTYLNLALNRVFSRQLFPEAERALLTELSYGVVQRLNTLDWVLALYLSHPLEKLTIWIRNILRMGAYQLLFLDRIPDSAAVDESVKLAHRFGHKGVAGLVNAVLRKVSTSKKTLPWPSREKNLEHYISLRYSYPLWMVQRWLKNMGADETEAFCSACNTVPPLTVRTNTLRLSRAKLKEILLQEGTEAKNCLYAAEGLEIKISERLFDLPSFREGFFQIQGEASMLAATSLNPQPGESVLDLCSAPGGKTIHMANLMQNQGNIVATDLYPHRLELVQKAAKHQGVKIIRTEKLDGRSLPDEKIKAFERVLLDVPCSGLGVIRRKTDLKWRRQPEDIASLSQLQLRLLKEGFKALRPKGVLLYSACTIEPEETTDVINKFLEQEPSARPAMFSSLLPEGLESKEGRIFLWPHKHNLDGFFLARIRKE
ncbi:MAG: 16S rRNA (cytosine(967)-C(5))-methyltransferase RsmB [Firmicutes bacterium]|nr:16S rRNA (cytosine(967)-C(5))-methyltransferase RsmB [Bacillota bacterium]